MTSTAPNPGSFRDPGSRIYERDGRIFRAVHDTSSNDYQELRDSGLLEELIEKGFLVSSAEVDSSIVSLDNRPAYLLEHARIPFLSYPYEWPFSLLKRAALFHLDLQLTALERGFTLSDATAYNVQFVGPKPIGIDHLSLRPYVEGEIWGAHRQFCMQFLNPIILWSRKGVSPNHWFRGNLEGISPEDLSKLLNWRDNLSWTVMTHVSGQAALQRRAVRNDASIEPSKQPTLSKTAFIGMLEGLKSYISGCTVAGEATVWGDYADHNSYDDAHADTKRGFVARMVEAVKPDMFYDFGCNSGDYSEVGLNAGAKQVVGFDFDYGALEGAVARADAKGLNLLPLWLDAANPSPSQGWAQKERMGLSERTNANALVALAFIHHIAIGRNVPIDMTIDWLMSLAPAGIIEFPSKADPMVKRLLANRPDIFPDYTEEVFLAEIGKRGRVVETCRHGESNRLMVWFDRT